MAEFDLCALEELPPIGKGRAFLVDGELPAGASSFFRSMLPPGKVRIALFRVGEGGVFACEDRCPHADAALANGLLRDGTLTCAAHGFGFDTATGSCHVRGPKPLVRYPVRVEGGRVMVTV